MQPDFHVCMSRTPVSGLIMLKMLKYFYFYISYLLSIGPVLTVTADIVITIKLDSEEDFRFNVTGHYMKNDNIVITQDKSGNDTTNTSYDDKRTTSIAYEDINTQVQSAKHLTPHKNFSEIIRKWKPVRNPYKKYPGKQRLNPLIQPRRSPPGGLI